MKTKIELKRKFALFATALLTFSSVAWAEHGPGNSGNAVLMEDGKYYLLDFVEAGIEKKSDLLDEKPIVWRDQYLPRVRRWAEKDLTMFSPDVRTGLAKILERVESTSPNYATVLYSAIRMHSWRFVEFPLQDILLDDSSIRIPHEKIHQAAIRRSRAILIQKNIWNGMDVLNRVGLVFHEALYALSALEKDASGFPIQRSWNIRQMVPDLFVAMTDGDAIQRALRRESQGKPVLPFMDTNNSIGYSFGWGGWGNDPQDVFYGGNNQISFVQSLSVTLYLEGKSSGIGHGININILEMPDGMDSIIHTCAYGTKPFPKKFEISTDGTRSALKFSSYDRPEGSYEYIVLESTPLRIYRSSIEERVFTAQNIEECVEFYTRYYKSEYERSRQSILRSIQ